MNHSDLDAILRDHARRALVMDLVAGAPPRSIAHSRFGAVDAAAPGESWPESPVGPLMPLCQIDLTALPFRPPRLDDLEFLAVFMKDDDWHEGAPGEDWVLRAYTDRSALVPLDGPPQKWPLRPRLLVPRVVEVDLPTHDDFRGTLPDGVDFYDHFETAGGLKLGGWPRSIQSEIYWAPSQAHPAQPEYVFQVDSTEEGRWQFADGGVGYFGRGTTPGREDEWAFEWQCY